MTNEDDATDEEENLGDSNENDDVPDKDKEDCQISETRETS